MLTVVENRSRSQNCASCALWEEVAKVCDPSVTRCSPVVPPNHPTTTNHHHHYHQYYCPKIYRSKSRWEESNLENDQQSFATNPHYDLNRLLLKLTDFSSLVFPRVKSKGHVFYHDNNIVINLWIKI